MTASASDDARVVRESMADALSAGFELVMTPAIFAFFGWLIDRSLGTSPVFTLVLGGVVLAYEVWKLLNWYTGELDKQLANRRATSAAIREAELEVQP